MSKFDFSGMAVDIASPRRMPLVYPGEVDPIKDGEGREGFLELLPWDSDAGRALDREIHSEAVRKGFRQKTAAELRAEAEAQDQAEEQVRRLAALCVGWHLVGRDGSVIEVPFSPQNAAAFFADPSIAWLRRRAYSYVASEQNFMKGSAKPS